VQCVAWARAARRASSVDAERAQRMVSYAVTPDDRDGMRPNRQRSQKMAEQWYAALPPLFGHSVVTGPLPRPRKDEPRSWHWLRSADEDRLERVEIRGFSWPLGRAGVDPPGQVQGLGSLRHGPTPGVPAVPPRSWNGSLRCARERASGNETVGS
jgi:hypothetical protein